MGASGELQGYAYKSSDVTVPAQTDSGAATIELVLTKIQTEPLPSAVKVKEKAVNQVIAEATDGARMVLPPASATQTGNVELSVKPTTEAPSQASAKVVSTVYDITVKSDNGSAVTKLSEEAEIVLP